MGGGWLLGWSDLQIWYILSRQLIGNVQFFAFVMPATWVVNYIPVLFNRGKSYKG